MNLLQRKTFTTHAGNIAHFKIECDALTDEELETFAFLISEKFKFKLVYGIPSGGNKIAAILEKYVDPTSNYVLIIDDVYTTGKSMEDASKIFEDVQLQGVVLFARAPIKHSWVSAVFQLWA